MAVATARFKWRWHPGRAGDLVSAAASTSPTAPAVILARGRVLRDVCVEPHSMVARAQAKPTGNDGDDNVRRRRRLA
jgi:hypothetical protein